MSMLVLVDDAAATAAAQAQTGRVYEPADFEGYSSKVPL
jgi:hypothetical protein